MLRVLLNNARCSHVRCVCGPSSGYLSPVIQMTFCAQLGVNLHMYTQVTKLVRFIALSTDEVLISYCLTICAKRIFVLCVACIEMDNFQRKELHGKRLICTLSSTTAHPRTPTHIHRYTNYTPRCTHNCLLYSRRNECTNVHSERYTHTQMHTLGKHLYVFSVNICS